jgi:hypothetical protein
MAHNSELTVKRIASLALMSDIDPASSCTVRAGVVGSMATQFARGAGYVIGTGRAPGRQTALDFGAQEFVDIGNDAEVGGVSGFRCPRRRHPERSAGSLRAGGTLVTLAGPTEARPSGGLTADSLSCPIAPNLVSSSGAVRDGRLRKDDHVRSSVRTRGLPNANETSIHELKESLNVEHDCADRFLSHA